MGNKSRTKYVSWRGRVWKSLADAPLQQFASADLRQYGFTRTAGDNPRYRVLIKAGFNASNNLSVAVSNAEAEDFKTLVYVRKSGNPSSPDWYRVGSFGQEGVFFGVNEPLGITSHSGSSSMDKARANAIRILNKKVTARRRQFQGLVFAGEFKKSVMMVFKPAKALRSKATTLIRRLQLQKRGKRGTSGQNWAKVVADTWLETVFGWKPLLSDMEDGAKALARTIQKDALEREQFRAFAEEEQPVLVTAFSTSPIGFDASSQCTYLGSRKVVRRSQCILYGRFETKLHDPAGAGLYASALAHKSGFNWADVPAQAWELCPWSFLVDYFTNVGDVLESVGNFRSGIKWTSEVQIEETEDLRDFTLDVATLKALLLTTYAGHGALNTRTRQSYKTVSRQQLAGDLSSSISLSIPGGLQWLNIAALVAGGRPVQPFLK